MLQKNFLSFYESIHLLECFEIGVVLSKKFRPFFSGIFRHFYTIWESRLLKSLKSFLSFWLRSSKKKKKFPESFWCIFHHRALCFL